MTTEEKREQVIQGLTNLLQSTPFTVEYKVKKKPAGIKVIIEVTQEQMGALAKQVIEKSNRIEKD
jgi:intracellular sulfur oxidation DsrE/DsrF family protein